jgi:hypothetical protein
MPDTRSLLSIIPPRADVLTVWHASDVLGSQYTRVWSLKNAAHKKRTMSLLNESSHSSFLGSHDTHLGTLRQFCLE